MDKILYIPRKNVPTDNKEAIKKIHDFFPSSIIYYLCNNENEKNSIGADKINDINVLPKYYNSSISRLVLSLRKEKFHHVVLGPPSKITGGEGGKTALALFSGAKKIHVFNQYLYLERLKKTKIVFFYIPARIGIIELYVKIIAYGYKVPVKTAYPFPIRIIIFPFYFLFYRLFLPACFMSYYWVYKNYAIISYQFVRPIYLRIIITTSYRLHRWIKLEKITPKTAPVIGIDAKCLGKSISGIERAIQSLLAHIQNTKTSNEFIFRIYALNPIPGINGSNINVKVFPSEQGLYWTLGKDLAHGKIDLFHVTWQEMFLYHSLPLKLAKKSVYTVYDLINLVVPDYHVKIVRERYRRILKKSVSWSTLVITSSQATVREIVKELDVAPGKMKVVYLGIDPFFHLVEREIAQNHVMKKFNVPQVFLLTVGRSYEHKNLVFLLEVFHHLIKKKQYPGDLVLIGDKYRVPVNKRIEDFVQETGIGSRFHWFNEVDDKDLLYFYNAAETFIFPSRHEGFGFPVLEAMACGTPVVSSSATSLAEIVGNAGMTFSPDDLNGFVESIWELHHDKRAREKFIKKGLENIEKYSWTKTTMETLKIYRRVLSGSN